MAEEATVTIDGKNVGACRLDQNNQTDDLKTSVSSPGRHNYAISATTTFLDRNRRPIQVKGTGQGTIEVGKASFSILWLK